MVDVPGWVRVGLAFALVGLLAATLILSFIQDDAGTRNLVVGAILGYVAAVVQYFFGSSDSSRKKDDTIADATVALATSTPGKPEPSEEPNVRQADPSRP